MATKKATTKSPRKTKEKPASAKKSVVLEAVPSAEQESFVIPEDKVLKDRYYAATGRRKTAIARAWLFTKGDRSISVNGKSLEGYFRGNADVIGIAASALSRMKVTDKFRTVITVAGGGVHAQAEAIRHATARALVEFNPEFRKRLKRAGFLTRDSRMVERKKFGHRKARRSPQWQKR